MPSLRHVLATHSPVLVLDGASTRVQVGVLTHHGPARWHLAEDEAGIALFQAVERLGLNPQDAAAFVLCEGPGSILGIRTAAMAVRAWCVLRARPVFTYQSLALVAHALDAAAVQVIADARRESWHHYAIGGTLRRVPTGELTGALHMPEGFRHWSALPPSVAPTPYAVGDLLDRTSNLDLLRLTEAPDAFLHEEPSYVTWTPQIHRAPTA